MQLQHPELLWGLWLLIIPILVHLLRLRRYRKTPFTNVKVLRKIFSESNRSSQLKRWLLLFTRLGLIGALVIGFCKPFIPSEGLDNKKDIVVYIDNSFSMQARLENSNLMEYACQQVLQNFPEDFQFSLVTQTESFEQVTIKELQQQLLNLDFSPSTLSSDEIRLRTSAMYASADSTDRELWVLSDFKGWDSDAWENQDGITLKGVQLQTEAPANISVDSAYLQAGDAENLEVVVALNATTNQENGAVSLYNEGVLIAKTGVEELPDGSFQAQFTIPADTEINGTLQVTDNGLSYDNTLYLTLNKPEKIKVLSIGEDPAAYLGRIFTDDVFTLVQTSLRELDYSNLEQQHLIVLNELETLPLSLGSALKEFVDQGGSLIVIPSSKSPVTSFNSFLKGFEIGYGPRRTGVNLITTINFDHPVYREVFERAIDNFEYPQTQVSYPLQGPLQQIIGFQDGTAFLSERNGIYLFAAPLSTENSNFTKSPLIVPTLYSIGVKSLPRPDLYFEIGKEALLDLEIIVQEDEILKLQGPRYEVIPLQQSFARKTRLYFGTEPSLSGNYQVTYGDESLRTVSFNYPRKESFQAASAATIPASFTTYSDVPSLISEYQNTTRVTSLWKWFIILALLFMMAEMILQKTMR
ncbi:BatA domain-containing protein [Robiginitalea aurantiaca]|uniref:BatA domain-containing protein n=1 Tax=Robiginitalea aurantiaca TaxID=3056915 RepID=A0ABT7WG02_9FLAO|nr:BatA domain-containing protein [Robiginitalea aurantiaca]MDM9631844.1 BatA domain-containing protein [Robiginitalea aurantiaca]